MMLRVTFLFLVSLAAVLTQHVNHKHVEFLQHCRMECCKIVEHEFDRALWDATVKECSHLQDVPPKCDQHQCISSKLGFTRADGSFIKANVTKTIELIFDGTPEVILAIKSNCIEGDLDAPNWHESETCELTKFWHCVDVQKLRYCPSWSNEGDCAGAKEQAATCFS